jgi:hypothetical protein
VKIGSWYWSWESLFDLFIWFIYTTC